jgi:hypothetical protein
MIGIEFGDVDNIMLIILTCFSGKATEIVLVATMKNINVFISDKVEKRHPSIPNKIEKQFCNLFDHPPGIADVF